MFNSRVQVCKRQAVCCIGRLRITVKLEHVEQASFEAVLQVGKTIRICTCNLSKPLFEHPDVAPGWFDKIAERWGQFRAG